VPAAIGLYLGVVQFLFAATWIVYFIYLPQLALVIRPKDLSGVSIISWCLACLTSLGWLVYGFLIHQPPLALPSFVMLPSAFIIFVQASRHRIKNNSRTGLQAPIVE